MVPANDVAEPTAPDIAGVPEASPEPQAVPAREAALKPAPKPKQRRGHAKRNAEGKYEPTGDYPNGFARGPLHTRFDGSRPGPGRPKGLRSQASFLREALNEKLGLTEDGVHRKITKRQVAAKLFVKAALENADKAVMARLQAEADRLFPEQVVSETARSPLGDASLDASIIAQFLASHTLGEPGPDADSAVPAAPDETAPLATGEAEQGPWDEGDWDVPGASVSENDDERDDQTEENGND